MKLAFAFVAAVALAFLTIPVVAIFARVPPGTLFGELDEPVVRDAIVVSARTSLLAHALVLLAGTPTAYVLANRRFPGRSLVLTLVELPLVLPPAVAGIGLLAAFGRTGLFSTSLPFTQAAVVVAIAFVASPFYIRTAIAAFESVDPTLVAAARTLGAGPWRVFARVALPLAAGGLGAGSVLAFARGLGEFGATIMFAGSLPHVTQTLSLAVYAEFARSFDTALAIGALLVGFSFGLLLVMKWLRFDWTSESRFAPSISR